MKLLKDQLAQNSSNSSRPPSQDGYKSGEKRSMRTPSGKSPGGQRGHKGTGGVLKENPDETILYKLETCPSCHRSVIDIPLDELVRKQVEDIPPLRTIVTEHQMEVKTCPDCQIQWMAGGCPPEVVHTFQYGPRIRAFSLYLSAYQFLPIKRTVQALALFGVALSCGTLDNFRKAAALDLVVFMATLKASVRKAISAFFDETGIKVSGKNHWIHVASTEFLSYFHLDTKRGVDAHTAIDILPTFEGVAHHDGYRSYNDYQNATHSLCCAHLLRELKFAIERDNQESWADPLIKLLLNIKKAVERSDQNKLDLGWQGRYRKQYRELVKQGLSKNPPAERPQYQKKGVVAQSKTYNLLIRLRDYEPNILRFMTHPQAEFDNNQAERDLRMNKVRAKVSGGFRSFDAGQEFMSIRSLIASAIKQGLDPIETLVQLCTPGNVEYLNVAKYPE
jgi:transposase